MRIKHYTVFLGNKEIGQSALDMADAQMGVVWGRVDFNDTKIDYAFLKTYCQAEAISFTDMPQEKSIITSSIPKLRVFNIEGVEIKGQSTSLSGSDEEGYEVYIEGIPYPFYAVHFQHHIQHYDNLFKSNDN